MKRTRSIWEAVAPVAVVRENAAPTLRSSNAAPNSAVSAAALVGHHAEFDEFDDKLAVTGLPSDAMAAFNLLRAESCTLTTRKKKDAKSRLLGKKDTEFEIVAAIPLVLTTAMYQVLGGTRSIVDLALDDLHRSHTIVLCRAPAESGETAALLMKDLIEYLEHSQVRKLEVSEGPKDDQFVPAMKIFKTILATSTKAWVDAEDLDRAAMAASAPASARDVMVRVCLQRGLLMRRTQGLGVTGHRSDSFWFSAPEAGPFWRYLLGGREDIMSKLRKRRYCEMKKSELLACKLPRSRLPTLTHVRDLLGSGLAVAIPSADGIFVRLATK